MKIGLTGEVGKICSSRQLHVFEMTTEVATVGERTVRRHLTRMLDECRLSVKSTTVGLFTASLVTDMVRCKGRLWKSK